MALNSTINNLPFELHIPGYQYCGPGTKLEERLAKGEPGINKVDAACKRHDMLYSKYKEGDGRLIADHILTKELFKTALTKDDVAFLDRLMAAWLLAAMGTKKIYEFASFI